MAVRKILRMGHPFLLQRARAVEAFGTPELAALVQDMFDTMRVASGAGLAAPQIGAGLRVVIFGFEKNPRYPDRPSIPETILINPVIEPLSETMDEDWEGCLSVPGLRGQVMRYTRVRYSGFDPRGTRIEREVDGFHARVVQHECDHLDGVLYPMRITDMSKLGYIDELVAAGRITVPVVAE